MTQTLDLNKMGLDPLNQTEMQEIDGGSLISWGAAILKATVSAVGDFATGVVQGYNQAAEQRIIDNSQQLA